MAFGYTVVAPEMPERHRASNRARQTVVEGLFRTKSSLLPNAATATTAAAVSALVALFFGSGACFASYPLDCLPYSYSVRFLSLSIHNTNFPSLFLSSSSFSSLSHNIAANVFFYSLDFCYAKCKHALVLLLVLLHRPIQFLLSATFLSFSFSFFIPFPLTLL